MPHQDEPPRRPLFDRSEDHAYFRAIEELFIELRGAPLQLSPDDFDVAKGWRADGVPLDVALSILREVAEKRLAKEEDPQRRLRYYRSAVSKAWDRQRELAAPGAAPAAAEIDIAGRLRRLAAAVPASFSDIHRSLDELVETAGASSEGVESALEVLDAELLARAEESLDADGLATLEERLADSLSALRGRLGGSSERTRSRLRRRWLRELNGLPVLSLFSPDAEKPISGG